MPHANEAWRGSVTSTAVVTISIDLLKNQLEKKFEAVVDESMTISVTSMSSALHFICMLYFSI